MLFVINDIKAFGTVLLSNPIEDLQNKNNVSVFKLFRLRTDTHTIFPRKVVKKGLLYFKSKIQAVDSTGEIIEYVTKIDKSEKLHIEFEGREAHHIAETFGVTIHASNGIPSSLSSDFSATIVNNWRY